MTTASTLKTTPLIELQFTPRISQLSKSAQYVYQSQNLSKLKKSETLAFSSKSKYEKLAAVACVLQNTQSLISLR